MMKACWLPVSPDAQGNYLASPGGRYAALLNVDTRASLSDVTSALAKEDFTVTYAWATGQPNRNAVFIDDWLAKLPQPASGTVWMYLELNFTGDMPKTVAAHIHKCILFICGDANIVYLLTAQQVADNYAPCGPGDPQAGNCPVLPPPISCPPAPSAWKPALIGAAVGGALVGAIVVLR